MVGLQNWSKDHTHTIGLLFKVAYVAIALFNYVDLNILMLLRLLYVDIALSVLNFSTYK